MATWLLNELTCVGALHGGVRWFCRGDVSFRPRDVEELLAAMRLVRQQDRHCEGEHGVFEKNTNDG